MNPEQLLDYIVTPSLAALGNKFAAREAAILLLATAAQESRCGEYVHQIGGPALGIFQCEPATHKLVLRWLLQHHPELHAFVTAAGYNPERLIYDSRYAVWIARLLYYAIPTRLPTANEEAMWGYYKPHYNSERGAATRKQWTENWTKYVTPALA